MPTVVIGSSGGLKGIFVQGVFDAFETVGFYADAYVGPSASSLPAVSAAAKLCHFVGIHYWQRILELCRQPETDLSEVMYTATREWNRDEEPFKRELFHAGRARLLIPANLVTHGEAAAETQSGNSRRLGRRLLLAAANGDRQWVDENLELHLFDTHPVNGNPALTADNLADVCFASARMIHWKMPAWVEGRPYVDASYTCASPVVEMMKLGYDEIITISTETGPLVRSLFGEEIETLIAPDVTLHIIRPDYELESVGVHFTECSKEGLFTAFEHGRQKGFAYLAALH